jgi:hypothetical protein
MRLMPQRVQGQRFQASTVCKPDNQKQKKTPFSSHFTIHSTKLNLWMTDTQRERVLIKAQPMRNKRS